MRLVLASTSPYRRELLARLRVPFTVARPEVDETPRPGEGPATLAARLAHAKAAAVAGGDPAMAASDRTTVRFRALTDAEIERYVDAEQPFDCAGSFKCEGLGIALFESIANEDPTALVGLPLIATAGLLRRAGFALP